MKYWITFSLSDENNTGNYLSNKRHADICLRNYLSQISRCMFYTTFKCISAKPDYFRMSTVYPKKYAHGFCFAVLCCGYTLTYFPISIRLTSLALWQSNDCPSASKASLMNMDKYFMWIHYERLHNHNKAKHNKTVCLFLGIYCSSISQNVRLSAAIVLTMQSKCPLPLRLKNYNNQCHLNIKKKNRKYEYPLEFPCDF